MRPKSLLLLFLALGCGLVASIGISQVLDKNREGTSGVETEAIYIAKVNVNLGDPIKAEMVSLEEWPKDKIPVGAIRELSEVEERRPRSTIFAGEPILDGKLLNLGEHADATESIPDGYRVLPISVKADTGMAGLINPGDRVDIQWFVPKNQSLEIEETITKTILHSIRVFAVDQIVRRMPDGEEVPTLAKTVSLLLTPKQANMVRLADKVGEISLVARHPDDTGVEQSADVNFTDLLDISDKSSRKEEQGKVVEKDKDGGFFGALVAGLKSKAAASAAAAAMVPPTPPFQMEVIVGEEVQVLEFSPIDGRPLDPEENDKFAASSYGGYPTNQNTASPPSFGGSGGSDTYAEGSGGDEDDFPIDLGEDD